MHYIVFWPNMLELPISQKSVPTHTLVCIEIFGGFYSESQCFDKQKSVLR